MSCGERYRCLELEWCPENGVSLPNCPCCATQDHADWRAQQLLGRQSPDSAPERTIRPSQCGSWTQIVPEIQARPSPASALGLVAELSNAAPLRTMLIAIVRRGVFFT